MKPPIKMVETEPKIKMVETEPKIKLVETEIVIRLCRPKKGYRLKSCRPLKGIGKKYVDLQKVSTQITPTSKKHQ
ncbi:acetyltransferase, GNAT family [Sesbania bispinosa]|nr:acetyltransferase, GNAT family [Sesbania bispinosa]